MKTSWPWRPRKSRSAASSRTRSTPSTPMRAKCGSGSDNERQENGKPAMALRTKSHDMGMHTERLAGRTQQRFFEPDEAENFTYPGSYDVDFNKRTEFDAAKMTPTEINHKLRDLMSKGYGTIVLKNPGAK